MQMTLSFIITVMASYFLATILDNKKNLICTYNDIAHSTNFQEKLPPVCYIMSPLSCNITRATDATDLKVKNLQLKRKTK